MTNLLGTMQSKTEEWVNVMTEKMDPLHKKDVTELVPTPICKKVIGLSGLQGKV